jgi:hypothetical protein
MLKKRILEVVGAKTIHILAYFKDSVVREQW